jgi:hypothetical protein
MGPGTALNDKSSATQVEFVLVTLTNEMPLRPRKSCPYTPPAGPTVVVPSKILLISNAVAVYEPLDPFPTNKLKLETELVKLILSPVPVPAKSLLKARKSRPLLALIPKLADWSKIDPGAPPIPEKVTPRGLYRVVRGVVDAKRPGAPVSKSIVVAKLLGDAPY